LIAGGSFAFINFYQLDKLEGLQESYAQKQTDYNNKREISNSYPELNKTYQSALAIIEGYNKSLFKKPDPDDVYDYLAIIGSAEDSKIYFDFIFVDSTAQDQYGILNAEINGYGLYTNVVNFINKLENSQLLNKVNELSINPVSGTGEELNEITFSFSLESYYERILIQETAMETATIVSNENISTYNPFYPLIQSNVPPNEGNLVNVEQSRMIGLTSSRIFVVDQNGNVVSLRAGDEVYLGQLESINNNEKSATFNLNKGGITELVTLEIER
jgi:hypothetical protein